MTDFDAQAYAEIRPRFEQMGDAIARAHRELLIRLEPDLDDAAALYLTRRAFELTDLLHDAAQRAMGDRAAELKAQAAGNWAVLAEPYCRSWMREAERELPGWTAICLLVPEGSTDACVGSTQPDVDRVAALILSVACKMLGDRTLPTLRRLAADLSMLDAVKTMPEAC